MTEQYKLMEVTINAKIAGYEMGIAHLKANGKTSFSESAIELSEHMIADLKEIKAMAVTYDDLLSQIMNKLKK